MKTIVSTTAATIQAVNADLLIPGRGDPIKDGTVIWQGNSILYAGPRPMVPDQYSNVPGENVPVLMPGMWDCHIHFLGALDANMQCFPKTSQIVAGARSVQNLHDVLMAGFTSVREVGGYGTELFKVVNAGHIQGPTIYSANSVISMTGGHADIHSMDLDHLIDFCKRGYPLAIADGIAECKRAVRLQARAGARLIKVCATGGVASELDDPQHQHFSPEELEAIVEEARRLGLSVAAHCHGKLGILAALRAGCLTIEHGSFVDDECVDVMREKGAILVATRTIIEGCLADVALFTPEAYKKAVALADAHSQAYKLAVAKGVKIALGTDIFLASQSPRSLLKYGLNGQELIYAVKAGMTPLQAVEAATANGPDTLGDQAPSSGQLHRGFEADMIAVAEDPLQNIECLADPQKIIRIWKHGKLVKVC